MNIFVPFWIWYALACCTAANRRLRWWCAFILIAMDVVVTAIFFVGMAFLYGMPTDNDGVVNHMDAFPAFMIATFSIYLLMLAIFVVVNHITAKTIIIILAHLVLLADLLYLKRMDFGWVLALAPMMLSLPIWILGFRLWPKPRKIALAADSGVVAGR